MYTRNFDVDGRLKTHRVDNATRTLTYNVASNPLHLHLERQETLIATVGLPSLSSADDYD